MSIHHSSGPSADGQVLPLARGPGGSAHVETHV